MKFQYFVGHVFDRQSRDDLRQAIREGLSQFEGLLSAFYADDVYREGDIFLQKIMPAIDRSVFCIFDVSDVTRPNVFLELGYSFGRRKPTLLICKRGTSLPSDILGFDRLTWDSYKHLSEELSRLAPSLMSRAVAAIGAPIAKIPATVFRAIHKGASRYTSWRSIIAANGGSTEPVPENLLRLSLSNLASKDGCLEGDPQRGFRFKPEARPVFASMLENPATAAIEVYPKTT